MPRLKYDPRRITIGQTIRCNAKCYFCWRNDSANIARINEYYRDVPKDMPFGLFQLIVDQANEVPSLERAYISGVAGEVFMDKMALDKFAYIKHRTRLLACANSNGLALHRFDLDKLVRNVDLLDVSLNSVDPATYHKIMGVNKLDVVLKNLRLLKKAIDSVKQKRKKAVRVAVRFIEGEYNAGQWSAFKELVEEDIGFPAFRKVVHSFKNILGKGDTKAKNKAKRCNQPFRHINFNVRGDMVSCCLDWDVENIFGNIREHTIKKMWESEGFERWRKNRLSTTCKKCLGV